MRMRLTKGEAVRVLQHLGPLLVRSYVIEFGGTLMESNNRLRRAAVMNLEALRTRRERLERDEAATIRAAHGYGVSTWDIHILTGLSRKNVKRALRGDE